MICSCHVQWVTGRLCPYAYQNALLTLPQIRLGLFEEHVAMPGSCSAGGAWH